MDIEYSDTLRLTPRTLSRAASSARIAGATPSAAYFWVQWLVAMVLISAALGLLVMDKTGDISSAYRVLAVITLLVSYPVYSVIKVYDHSISMPQLVLRVAFAWITVVAILTFVGFVTKTSGSYSRAALLSWIALGYGAQLAMALPIHLAFSRYYRRSQYAQDVLVVGSGEFAQLLADKLTRSVGVKVHGLIKHESEQASPSEGLYPILGGVKELRHFIRLHSITRLFIALPANHLDKVDELYVDLLDTPIDVVWTPDFANTLLLNHSVSDIEGLPAIHLNESPLTANPSAAFVKSLIDRFAALCAILLLSPVLIGAAIAVKLSSSGPVLFKQERHGLNGRIFHMWKYRSMRLHDDAEVKQATKGDSRITPVGAFIRKTSIDELPQLFNVLFGDMSLVGPRPHAVQHNDYYAGKIQAYMTRHKVKPGMTGWAQVNGSRGETETLEKMKRRLEYDLEYINTWSIWLDVQILLRTPLALVKDEAY